jgi:hypothetical protein
MTFDLKNHLVRGIPHNPLMPSFSSRGDSGFNRRRLKFGPLVAIY